jgi:hypothetical protein
MTAPIGEADSQVFAVAPAQASAARAGRMLARIGRAGTVAELDGYER